jgi:hypothetical protein
MTPEQNGGPKAATSDTPAVAKDVNKDRSWKDVGQTAVNGLKQALDLAAQSADACPPLKSVLGGLRAILRNCEVS